MSMPFKTENRDGLELVVAGFELLNERLDILTKSVENLHDKVTSANRSIDNVREEILQRIDMDKRNYSKEFEDWISKQPTRQANGLSISDTLTRSKDGEES